MFEQENKIEISPTLREYLTLTRNKKGLSKVSLSLLMGKDRQWFDDIESEKITNIQPEDLKLLFYILIPKVGRYMSDSLLHSIVEIIENGPFDFVVARIQRTKNFSLERALLFNELKKQTFFSGKFSTSINDNVLIIESELKLPKGYFNDVFSYKAMDFSERSMGIYYGNLKKVFLYLDYIEPEFIDKYLHFLGVPVPSFEKIIPCIKINSCYKYNEKLGNMGDWLDKKLENFKNLGNSQLYADKDFDEISSANIKPEHYYIFNKKQELYSKVGLVTNILNQIIDKIDENNYIKTIKYEAIITTILELLTTPDGLKICEDILRYPIHKLENSQLSKVSDFLSDVLKYQYCIIKQDNSSDNSIFNIVSLLKKYIYLDCISKENINVIDCNDSIQSVFPK